MELKKNEWETKINYTMDSCVKMSQRSLWTSVHFSFRKRSVGVTRSEHFFLFLNYILQRLNPTPTSPTVFVKITWYLLLSAPNFVYGYKYCAVQIFSAKTKQQYCGLAIKMCAQRITKTLFEPGTGVSLVNKSILRWTNISDNCTV